VVQIFGLSGFFHPDLRQYRIKSALFTSHNPDFSALSRFCILKYTDRSQGKIRQLSDTTPACSPSPTNIYNYTNNGHNCTQHADNRRDDYYVTHRHSISRWR